MKLVKPKKIHWVVIIAILVALGLALIGWLFWRGGQHDSAVTNADNNPTTTTNTDTKASSPTVIHVAAMGDMLAHDTIIANAKTDGGYDFAKFFTNIRPSYQNADVIFCNQEGLVSGEAYGISGYPSFNAPTQFAAGLQSGAGCNTINLANNHMGDKGVAATNATIDVWAKLNPLLISGANKTAEDQAKISIATVKGVKIAFLAFADFNNNKATPGYSVNNYHDQNLVKTLVTQARSAADIVMVSMHWGVEDSASVSQDQRDQVALLSSLGVDVVIGTGPHVLQAAEVVTRPDGGKMSVWYSIGNMLSSQLDIRELISGIAGFDITKVDNQPVAVSNLTFIPTYMHYEWTAAQAANSDLLARKNAMIYLSKDAEVPLSKSLFNTTISDQRQYIINTLGSDVVVK